MTRAQFLTTIAVGSVFAAVGSLASAYDVERGFDLVGWSVRSCATLAVIVFVLGVDAIGRRPTVISAMFVALLFPYAVESVSHPMRADLALIATVVSVGLARSGGTARLVASGLAAGLACMCEVTALVWPIGCALAAVSGGEIRRRTGTVFAFGVVGLVLGWARGWSFVSDYAVGAGLAAAHRDLAILLPLVLLGAVGYAKARSGALDAERVGSATLSWTTTAMVCLFLALLGAPLDLRLCVLPMVLWMPVAFVELKGMVAGSHGRDRAARGVGCLSCAVVVGLLIPGVLRLLDGPLIAVYLLGG